MKLSEAFDEYPLVTSWSEGIAEAVYYDNGDCIELAYSIDGHDYWAKFDDQEVIWTRSEGCFVVSDKTGHPWEFRTWRPAR